MKSKGWKEEQKHLAQITREFEKRINAEQDRSNEKSLDNDRKKSIEYLIEQLKEQKLAPYFGRMDASFGFSDKLEKMYIGPTTFFDADDQVQIYDWRAPIASLYYEGTLGELTYQTPEGKEQAKVYLKRDIVIRNGELQRVYDVENQEARLMETLGASSNRDGHLEGITATIQKEQNEIIRHIQRDWLVVNGCAGSGKTTILLQRIAYLMYHLRKEVMNDMLLLSRNQLFAQYISHVIPQLTGSSLYQKTIWQKTVQLFKTFHLHHGVKLVNDKHVESHQESAYLPDIEWVKFLQEKIDHMKMGDIHFKSLKIKGFRIFSQQDMQRLSEQTNPTLPIHQQLMQIQRALEKNIKRRLNKFFVSQKAIAIYESLSPVQLEILTHDQEFSNEVEYHQFLGNKVFEAEITTLKEQIEVFAFVDVTRHLLDWQMELDRLRNSLHLPPVEGLPVEEVAPGRIQVTAEGIRVLSYLSCSMAPIRQHNGYSHLFIDEIQDVSLLLMSTLSKYYFRARFTVVGDSYQVFDRYPTIFELESFDKDLREALFPNRSFEERSLAISYRCTAQITRFANGVMGWPLDKNVFPRTGRKPLVWKTSKANRLKMLRRVIEETDETMHTTAIICRTSGHVHRIQEKLLDLELPVLEKGSEFSGSAFILTTINAAKGLEFDQVIMMDSSQTYYSSQKERAMFYTSCTRAKHQLHCIVDEENISPFILQNQAEYEMI